MHRNHGIPKAFTVDATFAADRKIGELVRVKPNGNITDVMGEGDLLYFPLVEDVVKGQTLDAAVTVVGVAKVYVEAAAGITAGVEVGLGVTGKGAAVYASGFKLGMALATPKGNGDFIPVLLAPSAYDSQY